MEIKYIAYYRLSKMDENESTLGLESQRETVHRYIKNNGNRIVAEFTEIESGKNDKRPELIKAIQMAKQHDATLIISKLDRLSRNLTFISTLMDNRVRFVCCDMPDANEFTIHIFASLAQWERKRISERTKEALDQKRLREPNWKPGPPHLTMTADVRAKGQEAIYRKARDSEPIRKAFHFISLLRLQGVPWKEVSERLNTEGYKTIRGGKFHPMTALQIYKRLGGSKTQAKS